MRHALMCFVVLILLPSISTATDRIPMKIVWQCDSRSGNGSITPIDEFLIVNSIKNSAESEALFACIRQDNGDEIWQRVHARLGDQFLDNSATAPGSMPIFAGKSLVYINNRCELANVLLNKGVEFATDGWRIDLKSKLGVFKRDDLEEGTPGLTPTIIDGSIILATGNGSTLNMHDRLHNVPAPFAPAWASFDITDGKLLWTNNEPSAAVIHSSCSSPVALTAEMLVAAGGDGSLYVLNRATGKTMAKYTDVWCWSWTAPVVSDGMVLIASSLAPGDRISREPAVLCYSISDLQKCLSKVEPIWEFRDKSYSGTWFTPYVLGDSVFLLTSHNDLVEISLDSGRLVSLRELNAHEKLRPCVKNRHIYVANSNEVVSYSPGVDVPHQVFELPDRIDGNFAVTDCCIFVSGQTTLRCYERLEKNSN
jgi:outer membrane protein assembly factor BamB